MLDQLPDGIIGQLAQFCTDKNRILLKNISSLFNKIITPQIAFRSWTISSFYYRRKEWTFLSPLPEKLCCTILHYTERLIVDDQFYDRDMNWITIIYEKISKKIRKIQELILTNRSHLFSDNVFLFIQLSPKLNNIYVQHVSISSSDEPCFYRVTRFKKLIQKRESKRNVQISVSDLCIICESEGEAFQFADFGATGVEHLTIDIFSPINKLLNYSSQMPNWFKSCETLQTFNWALLFSTGFADTTSFKHIKLFCPGHDGPNEDGSFTDTCSYFYNDITNILPVYQKTSHKLVSLQQLTVEILSLDHYIVTATIIYKCALQLILSISPNLQLLTFTHFLNRIDKSIIERIVELVNNYCIAFRGLHVCVNYYADSCSSFIEICTSNYEKENKRVNKHIQDGFEILSL